MPVSNDGIEINRRFFEALDVMKRKRITRGMQTFTKRYDINYWNFHSTRAQPNERPIRTEWLAYLVKDYEVSADFLLSGKGPIFSNPKLESCIYVNKGEIVQAK